MTTEFTGEAEETVDVKATLVEFWLTMMKDPTAPASDRIKSSEMLAKYVLDTGSGKIKKKQLLRPATAEVLRLATQIEREEED
jgi:hypothetical protein